MYTKVLREGLELDSFRHAHMPPPESQTMGSKLKQHPSTPCSEEEEERVTIEDGWRWRRGKRHGVRVHCVALKDRLDKMLRRLRIGPITSFALTDSLSVVTCPSPHYARFCSGLQGEGKASHSQFLGNVGRQQHVSTQNYSYQQHCLSIVYSSSMMLCIREKCEMEDSGTTSGGHQIR